MPNLYHTSVLSELIRRFKGEEVCKLLRVVTDANESLMALLLSAYGPRSDAQVAPGDRLAVWTLGGIVPDLVKEIGDYLGAVYNEEEWPMLIETMDLCELTTRVHIPPMFNHCYAYNFAEIMSFDEKHWEMLAMYQEAREALRDYHDPPELSWLVSLDEEQMSTTRDEDLLEVQIDNMYEEAHEALCDYHHPHLSCLMSSDEEHMSTTWDEDLLEVQVDTMYEEAHEALCDYHDPQLYAMYDDEKRSTSSDEELLEAVRD